MVGTNVSFVLFHRLYTFRKEYPYVLEVYLSLSRFGARISQFER